MILVIDDLRSFPFHATYARTSAQGLVALDAVDRLDELYLDHDLGGDDTIMLCVDYLMERAYFGNPLPIGRVTVHTSNPPGAETIMRSLSQYYRCRRVDAKMLGATVD